MKVLLATTAGHRGSERWMPIGMLYLSSMLKSHGHEVRICDRQLTAMRGGAGGADGELLAQVKAFRPDIVGFNTISPQIYDTVSAVKLLRDSGYAGEILLGGHHATAMPELTLERIPGADALITGEGERPLALYADGTPRAQVPALYWREGGRILSTKPAQACRLDDLPMPDYGQLDGWYTGRNAYTIRGHHLKVGSVLASRGCFNRCAYCAESLTYARGVRCHSAGYVAENVELLHRKYGCDGITFFDNDFLAVREQGEATLRLLISKGLNKKVRLCVQSRVDRFDEDAAKLLKEAGCVKVEFGFETISPAALKDAGKNASIEAGEQAAALCHKYGLGFQANMIAGLAGDSPEMVDRTMEWLKGIGAENIKWGMLMMLPGTRLYNECGSNFFENNDWTEQNISGFYNADHFSGMAQGELSGYMRASLADYSKTLHYRTLWRVNPPHRAFGYYVKRLLEKAEEAARGKQQGTTGLS